MAEWRVAAFDYEVSDDGQVRRNGKTLKGWVGKNGYRMIYMRGRKVYVHRLVASAFVGEITAGMEVAHGNSVRLDNRVSNLRITSRADNLSDKVAAGTNGWKLSHDQVLSIRQLLASGESQDKIATQFSVTRRHINNIARRAAWANG